MGEVDSIEEGERMITSEERLRKVVDQLDNIIEDAEIRLTHAEDVGQVDEVEILPGFSSSITGELVLLDSDNINTGKPGGRAYNNGVYLISKSAAQLQFRRPTLFTAVA